MKHATRVDVVASAVHTHTRVVTLQEIKWLAPLTVAIALCFASSLALAGSSFNDEFVLAVKAGREKLTDNEKRKLLDQNHPILFQMADAKTFALVKIFANLPDTAHKELLKSTYLKWKYSDLDESRQEVYRDLVQANIAQVKAQGDEVQGGFSVDALPKSEVGFAVVEIEKGRQKVVSLFVLFPDLPTPIWVTVVNLKAAGTMIYIQSHLKRLPMLRAMPTTALPK